MKPTQIDAVGRGAWPRPANLKEKAMLKQRSLRRKAAFAVVAAVLFSVPTMSEALAQPRNASETAAMNQCTIVGAISHRCLAFHSDSAWPEGLADYHGSNGG
jgi:hypothetical protein